MRAAEEIFLQERVQERRRGRSQAGGVRERTARHVCACALTVVVFPAHFTDWHWLEITLLLLKRSNSTTLLSRQAHAREREGQGMAASE